LIIFFYFLLGLGFWAWHIGAVGASLLGPEFFFDNFKYTIFGMLCFGSSPNLTALERIKKNQRRKILLIFNS
jgi:hypothetical protein